MKIVSIGYYLKPVGDTHKDYLKCCITKKSLKQIIAKAKQNAGRNSEVLLFGLGEDIHVTETGDTLSIINEIVESKNTLKNAAHARIDMVEFSKIASLANKKDKKICAVIHSHLGVMGASSTDKRTMKILDRPGNRYDLWHLIWLVPSAKLLVYRCLDGRPHLHHGFYLVADNIMDKFLALDNKTTQGYKVKLAKGDNNEKTCTGNLNEKKEAFMTNDPFKKTFGRKRINTIPIKVGARENDANKGFERKHASGPYAGHAHPFTGTRINILASLILFILGTATGWFVFKVQGNENIAFNNYMTRSKTMLDEKKWTKARVLSLFAKASAQNGEQRKKATELAILVEYGKLQYKGREAFEKKQWDKGQQYFQKAREYAWKDNMAIKTEGLLDTCQLLKKADISVANSEWVNARNYASRALAYIPGNKHAENIVSTAYRHLEFEDLIIKGKKSMEQRKYEEALVYFTKAKSLAENFQCEKEQATNEVRVLMKTCNENKWYFPNENEFRK